jgi:hypothetical protein
MKNCLCCLIALLLLGRYLPLLAQQDVIGNAAIPSHPRILLLKGEEKNILAAISRNNSLSTVHQAIIGASDQLLGTVPVERIKIGRRLLDKSREALRRIYFLSYAYRTTGQAKYAARAEKEMLAVSAFSDWNPSHFLDVAEMTMAMAIGYDWLYDYLPAGSKQTIKNAILEKGINPSLDPKNNRNWLTVEHNWNQVCNTGIAYGAMAVYEDQPVLAKQVINRSIASVPAAMKDYGPDGIYPEGYSYWGYGTSFNVMFISALDKMFGTDFGLSAQPGFLHTGSFLENMTGPTGQPFNYSDSGPKGGMEPAMFWFAAKTSDPSLLWVEKGYLDKPAATYTGNRLLPGVILWGRGADLDHIAPPKATTFVGRGKNPMVLMRTSWTDKNAIYVAIKGGSGSINHAHMDVGSFVMDAEGERWAMDFGSQEYESLESKGLQIFGRTQDAQRWTVYRYINQVHNTLTINDKHQWVAGFAPLLTSSATAGFMDAIFDLSGAYQGQLQKAERGAAIIDKAYAVIRDELTTGDTITTVRWTMLTPAKITITGTHSAELAQHGKTLRLEVNGPEGIAMKTWQTDPPPHDYDAPNPGTTLTGFEVTLPARTTAAFTITLLPGKVAAAKGAVAMPLASWPKDSSK